MTSWDKDAVQDLGCVYETKTVHDRGDIDTVWQSMYEKSLGRKVSQYCLPPQASTELNADTDSAESGPPSAHAQDSGQDKPIEPEAEKSERCHKDLASVHLERALNLGKLGKDDGRRWRKRTYSNSSSGEHDEKHN